jgi:hypothetical protein
VVEGPGACGSTGAQGCGSSTPTPAAMPDFLIRAHRPRDGCGARRSHQIDRRPPFVRMEPAVSARALSHRPGAGDQTVYGPPFPLFLFPCAALRCRCPPTGRPYQMPCWPRPCTTNLLQPPRADVMPGPCRTSEPAEPLRLYSFAPAGGARRQRVLPTSFLNTNNSSQSLRGCLVPSSEIFWPGRAGPPSRWWLRRLLRGKPHRRHPPRRSPAPIAAHAK